MHIAYLVNRYPATSHSFIRREILAVEASGMSVSRFSIRSPDPNLPDAQDRHEAELTTTILQQGPASLALAAVRMLMSKPQSFLSALLLSLVSFLAGPQRGWRHFVYLAEACWLALQLAGVDHLHAHFGTNPAAVARLVNRLTGIPYSFTVHGPDEFDAPVAFDLDGKITDARAVVAISSFGRSQLMRWSDPAQWHKIAVVRCGVDQVFTSEPTAITRQESTFCCVARLSAQKGLPLLIAAAARLAVLGLDFHIVLVGDGEMRREIEKLIAEHHLQQRFTITGYVASAKVRDIVATSRALVLPSFAEGLPVVIMEALAMQTPVIVTAIAGTPELVDDECGWLIPSGSVDALAEAMVAALTETADEIAAKGAVGRRRVLEFHDSLRNGRALADLFRS